MNFNDKELEALFDSVHRNGVTETLRSIHQLPISPDRRNELVALIPAIHGTTLLAGMIKFEATPVADGVDYFEFKKTGC